MTPLDEQGLPPGYPFRPDWEITPRQTKDLLAEQAEAVLLDCRRPEELDIARVPGAVHIPMDEIERRGDELETDDGGRDHVVAVICHSGRRSLRVAAALRAMGYPRAVSVAGGIDLWAVDIDPAIPRY